MAFSTFIDDLALVETLLAIVGALLAYAGVRVWWAIRTNDAEGLKTIMRGVAVPAGALGGVVLLLAVWGEMTWPFLASDGLAGYNIFFFDPMVLLGLVLIAYAVAAGIGTKMQYVGLFALVAGAVTLFYGYTGYTANPAFTKDPFDTLLLYAGFGAAGIFSFPATVVVDHFVRVTHRGEVPFAFASRRAYGLRAGLGQRGAQPIMPASSTQTPAEAESESRGYHVPMWAQGLLLLFPVFMALATIAAFWYFGVTLPGHLGQGAAGAP